MPEIIIHLLFTMKPVIKVVNPNNITIMGQSAGAMSVQQLCMSPLTKGLFNKAVMCSGGGVHKILSTPRPEKFYEFNNKVMDLTGAKTIEEFKKVPIEKLFNAGFDDDKLILAMQLEDVQKIEGLTMQDINTIIKFKKAIRTKQIVKFLTGKEI